MIYVHTYRSIPFKQYFAFEEHNFVLIQTRWVCAVGKYTATIVISFCQVGTLNAKNEIESLPKSMKGEVRSTFQTSQQVQNSFGIRKWFPVGFNLSNLLIPFVRLLAIMYNSLDLFPWSPTFSSVIRQRKSLCLEPVWMLVDSYIHLYHYHISYIIIKILKILGTCVHSWGVFFTQQIHSLG